MTKVKRNVLVITMSLALAFTMVPMMAPKMVFAAGENVKVCGITVSSADPDDVLGDGSGTVKWDQQTKTLTLTNADLSYNTTVVDVRESDVTVKLEGDNKITCTGTDQEDNGIYYNGDGFTINGSGKLTVNTDSHGITNIVGQYDRPVPGDIVIDGVTLDLNSAEAECLRGTMVTIQNGAKITAKAGRTAIYGINGITIRDSEVTKAEANWWGLTTYFGPMKIENSKVTSSSKVGTSMYAEGGISITKKSNVTSSAGGRGAIIAFDSELLIDDSTVEATCSGRDYAIYGETPVTIRNNANVTAYQTNAELENYAAIGCGTNLTIDSSRVKAEAANRSYGIRAVLGKFVIKGDSDVEAEGGWGAFNMDARLEPAEKTLYRIYNGNTKSTASENRNSPLMHGETIPPGEDLWGKKYLHIYSECVHDWQFAGFEWQQPGEIVHRDGIYATYSCKNDPAHTFKEHNALVITVSRVEPSCEKDGGAKFTAEINASDSKDGQYHKGEKEVLEPGTATGHQWDAGKVTKAPTETEEGIKTFTCTVCKATKTEPIPKRQKNGVSPVATGDESNRMTLVALLLASAGTLGALGYRRKKGERESS